MGAISYINSIIGSGPSKLPHCLNHVTAMVELCSKDTAGLPRQNTSRLEGPFPMPPKHQGFVIQEDYRLLQ